MSAIRILFLVLGLLGLLVALSLFTAGGAITWFHNEFRDDDGFYTTKTVSLASDAHAITTHPAQIDVEAGELWHWDDAGTIKIVAENELPLKGVFIGIGKAEDVRRYLRDVAYDEIEELHVYPYEVTYQPKTGAGFPEPPDGQPFWIASTSGRGSQTLQWQAEEGTWMLVLMNADGSPGIDLKGEVGVKFPGILWIGIGLIIGGAVTLAVSILFLVLAIRRPREPVMVASGT